MRLVLFEKPGSHATPAPGVWTQADTIIDVSSAVASLPANSPQEVMQNIIDNYEVLRPDFERLVERNMALPMDAVRLRPPLPRPGKILCCIGNYWEHDQREPRALNMFLKNPDAVIGPCDTVVLPLMDDKPVSDGPGPYMFQHEAELGLVMRGPAKHVSQDNYRKAIFGITGVIDVSGARNGALVLASG